MRRVDARVTRLSHVSCMTLSRDEINDRIGRIVDAAMKVHTLLGPGMLEGAYQACLAYELAKRGFEVRTQVPIPLVYEAVRMDAGYRADIVVDDAIVLELKAVERLAPVHEMQLVSHLRMGGFRIGLLMNFHEARLKDGLRRRVNNL